MNGNVYIICLVLQLKRSLSVRYEQLQQRIKAPTEVNYKKQETSCLSIFVDIEIIWVYSNYKLIDGH